jgi:pimeloyl-ACP methyl ester carboxylesterase
MAFMRGPGLSWLASVPPVGRRFQAMMTGVAFSPEGITPGYVEQLAANFRGAAHVADVPFGRGRPRRHGGHRSGGAHTCRCWSFHGADDHLVPVAVGRTLAEHAPNARLWVIPQAGHMLPLTRPSQLADRLVAFADGG